MPTDTRHDDRLKDGKDKFNNQDEEKEDKGLVLTTHFSKGRHQGGKGGQGQNTDPDHAQTVHQMDITQEPMITVDMDGLYLLPEMTDR